jgi:hypothetical protein
MSYIVVHGQCVSMTKIVNTFLDAGFKLHHSISTDINAEYKYFTQPMVHDKQNLVKTITGSDKSNNNYMTTLDVVVLPNYYKKLDEVLPANYIKGEWLHCRELSGLFINIYYHIPTASIYNDANISQFNQRHAGGRRSRNSRS